MNELRFDLKSIAIGECGDPRIKLELCAKTNNPK